MGSARLFVAFDLAPEAKQRLDDCRRQLRPGLGNLKWVRPEALHLTVRFLGETALERLDDLGAAVQATAAAQPPFSFSLRGLGVFPEARRPVVFWAGVADGRETLQRFAEDLRTSLALAGFGSDDRPFLPHVTLARARPDTRLRAGPVQQLLAEWSGRHLGETRLDHVTVYASTLTPAGPLYEVLRQCPLAPPPA